MDEETREALEMTAEELRSFAVQGRPVSVAKVPPIGYRITKASIQVTTTTTLSTNGRIRTNLHPAPALPRHILAAR